MRKTMVAAALSFLMAAGGVALANSNSATQGSPSSSTPSSQTQGAQGTEHQQGTHATRQAAPANGQAPVGFAEEEVTSGPFTVQSVDKKNRNVVVRAPDGTESTVNIPAGTPGFDSLNKGDNIQFDYFAAAVFGPGNQQANRASQSGSTPGSSSSAAANNHIGRVSNIRKMNDNGNSNTNSNVGHSGHTQSSGSQGSGSDQGNR